MAYTADPSKTLSKLQAAGLGQQVEEMRQLTLEEPLIITAESSTALDRIRHLLYSFFKHHDISGAYRIKWDSPLSFKVEPTIQRVNIMRQKEKAL